MNNDVIIVGGGIIGLATAYRLMEARPGLKLALLEKEPKLAMHQTGRNSGVLHSGLYYKPESEKAKLSVNGLQQLIAFCSEHKIPFEQCGKIVVATSETEVPRLENLWQRGNANGLLGLRKLDRQEIREIEPHAAGVAAIHVPQEGIVDFPAVCEKLANLVRKAGGQIIINARAEKLASENGEIIVETKAGLFRSRFAICCGGLQSDRIIKASGQKPSAKIIPFRGEYYQIKKERQFLVRNLIYPVPDPQFPFLGVHFTRLIHGGIEAGPNAVLAFAREGYSWSAINPRDLAESLAYPGLWKFLARYPSLWSYEIFRSISRAEFTRSLQRLVPEIRSDDLERGGSAVRAQAMTPDGNLVEDFHFDEAPGILHVVNAPSPAATASLAIGQQIAQKALTQLTSLIKQSRN